MNQSYDSLGISTEHRLEQRHHNNPILPNKKLQAFDAKASHSNDKSQDGASRRFSTMDRNNLADLHQIV